jgi:hypothetical protein
LLSTSALPSSSICRTTDRESEMNQWKTEDRRPFYNHQQRKNEMKARDVASAVGLAMLAVAAIAVWYLNLMHVW